MDGSKPLNTEPGEPAAKEARDEAGALEAVEKHHAGMRRRLDALVSTLTHAVTAGDTVAEHDAHGVLVEWCETELVPHALAEEAVLYPGARELPEGRLLVDGMLTDHQAIAGIVEELRGAAGVAGASAAGALRHVFASHVAKEDRLLMPLIGASEGLSLAQAVEGLSELVGETHVHRAHTGRGGSV
ncbi:hemerythrin domain-containing protein [Arthrobacter sp. UYCu712]|uniref:hemerythrin domain-containing protein n=1 Tax=Arthrobacter sp. UYCu712 TaxID=3156340 RepID=UPI003395C2AF